MYQSLTILAVVTIDKASQIMSKSVLAPSVILGLIVSSFTSHAADESIAEIMLASKLDESRGYCIDIAGGQGANAPIERGLQAHTCYNYTGGILEDQGFDVALLAENQFRITYFDVCMTASSVEQGATLGLKPCDGSKEQSFSLTAQGNIVSQSEPSLCVTVNSTEKKEGRGGSPAHVMRPISLELCEADSSDYQIWMTNTL